MVQFGLKESIIKNISSVLSHHPAVDKAILYGSRAKGNYRNGSDIDMTLCGGEDLTMSVQFKIMEELDNLLLPYTFDISILRNIIDSDVIEHINRVGCVIYEKTAHHKPWA